MPTAGTTCPSASTIQEYLAKGSRSPESQAVRNHLAGCAACCQLLATMTPPAADGTAPTLVAPSEPGGDGDAPGSFVLVTVDEGRYEVVREIARGGMGRIFEAWDRRHQRRVAIKVLLHTDSEAEKRFVREARITARLQHPAIIPLYEAGQWTRGEPFFAMKLVEGGSLADVIEKAKTPGERLALLPNIIAMTEALAYAHDQGIIHRDLKPSNVLIGSFGETVVIDWGIAKHVGVSGDVAGIDGAPTTDQHDFRTRVGSAMGTVGYMAPEQARGAVVDARADVYSLGALLYHLFAGTPPHLSNSVAETLRRVMSGPPDPLSKHAPELAPDIVAIVEKAMSREPGDRYPDARSMAEDLKRFAAGKLVSAHSYSLRALLGRWVVRHRAVVATAGVLVLALAVTLTVSVRRVMRERDKADAARQETERARAVAVAQREAAEKLVDFMVKDLKMKLQTVGRLDLIVGVGDEIDRYYEAASQTSPDADALVRRAQALQLVAMVEDYKLDGKGAAPLFEHAIALAEHALALAPNDLTAQVTLVNLEVNVAGPLMDLGRLDLAEQHARHAVEVGKLAVASHPDDARAALVLSRGQLRLALVLRRAGRSAETPELYADASALLDRAVAAKGENEALREAGWGYFERGDAALERGDVDDAAKSFARSVEVRERLYTLEPTPLRASEIAWSRLKASGARVWQGQFDDGLADGARAVARLEETSAKDMGSARTRTDLADAFTTQATTELAAERCAAASVHARRGSEMFDLLATEEPSPDTENNQLEALGVLGEAELCAGHRHQARIALERTGPVYAKVADAKLPATAESMDRIGPALARAELADGDPGTALGTARAAVARAEVRVAGAPKDDYHALEAMGLAELALGDVQTARHDPASAASYRAAHDAFVRRLPVLENPLVDPVTAALAAVKLARVAPRDEQRALLDEAVNALEALDRAHRLVPRGVAALRDALALRTNGTTASSTR